MLGVACAGCTWATGVRDEVGAGAAAGGAAGGVDRKEWPGAARCVRGSKRGALAAGATGRAGIGCGPMAGWSGAGGRLMEMDVLESRPRCQCAGVRVVTDDAAGRVTEWREVPPGSVT